MADYIIELKTKKFLGEPAFVHELLREWYEDLNPGLRPEFFDLGEPVRQSFADVGIDGAAETWLSNGMGLVLKRRTKPKFTIEFDWFNREKGLDPRLFPWGCSVSLSRSAGDKLALELFGFLIEHLEPAFGYVAEENDQRMKHFITFDDSLGTSEMFVGLDILDTDKKLPGVYWATYFGPWAVTKIGGRRFTGLDVVENVAAGRLVLAYSDSSASGTFAASNAEEQIKEQLGVAHFFDKSKVDIRKLMTDADEADMIQEKIDAVKKRDRPPV